MLLSKCAVCDTKKSKEEKASGLLNKLTRLKVRILSDLPLANISFKSIK